MTLYTLILLTIFNHSVFMGSRVAISLYALHLHASPLTVGILISLYGLLPALIAVSAGRLTDRVGARMPMLAGSILVAAGAAVPCVLPGLGPLYAAVILIGLGFTIYQITVQNVTGFIGEPQDRAANFSLLSLAYSISAFGGPMLSGFAIDSAGYPVTFLLLALLALPSIVLLGTNKIALPQPASRGARNRRHKLVDLLANRDLRGVFIITSLQVTSWELFTFMMPVYGSGIGLSPSVIGIIMGTFAVALFLIRFSLPALSRHVRPWPMVRAALLISAGTFIVFPLTSSVPVLMTLAFALGIGLGATQPMVMALLHNAAPEGRAGEAVGLRAAIVTTAQTAMPLVFGATGTAVGLAYVFWVVAAALVVGSRTAKSRYVSTSAPPS